MEKFSFACRLMLYCCCIFISSNAEVTFMPKLVTPYDQTGHKQGKLVISVLRVAMVAEAAALDERVARGERC